MIIIWLHNLNKKNGQKIKVHLISLIFKVKEKQEEIKPTTTKYNKVKEESITDQEIVKTKKT
jgi:hypothetical protein